MFTEIYGDECLELGLGAGRGSCWIGKQAVVAERAERIASLFVKT